MDNLNETVEEVEPKKPFVPFASDFVEASNNTAGDELCVVSDVVEDVVPYNPSAIDIFEGPEEVISSPVFTNIFGTRYEGVVTQSNNAFGRTISLNLSSTTVCINRDPRYNLGSINADMSMIKKASINVISTQNSDRSLSRTNDSYTGDETGGSYVYRLESGNTENPSDPLVGGKFDRDLKCINKPEDSTKNIDNSPEETDNLFPFTQQCATTQNDDNQEIDTETGYELSETDSQLCFDNLTQPVDSIMQYVPDNLKTEEYANENWSISHTNFPLTTFALTDMETFNFTLPPPTNQQEPTETIVAVPTCSKNPPETRDEPNKSYNSVGEMWASNPSKNDLITRNAPAYHQPEQKEEKVPEKTSPNNKINALITKYKRQSINVDKIKTQIAKKIEVPTYGIRMNSKSRPMEYTKKPTFDETSSTSKNIFDNVTKPNESKANEIKAKEEIEPNLKEFNVMKPNESKPKETKLKDSKSKEMPKDIFKRTPPQQTCFERTSFNKINEEKKEAPRNAFDIVKGRSRPQVNYNENVDNDNDNLKRNRSSSKKSHDRSRNKKRKSDTGSNARNNRNNKKAKYSSDESMSPISNPAPESIKSADALFDELIKNTPKDPKIEQNERKRKQSESSVDSSSTDNNKIKKLKVERSKDSTSPLNSSDCTSYEHKNDRRHHTHSINKDTSKRKESTSSFSASSSSGRRDSSSTRKEQEKTYHHNSYSNGNSYEKRRSLQETNTTRISHQQERSTSKPSSSSRHPIARNVPETSRTYSQKRCVNFTI